MDELLDLVNENDEVIGEVWRSEAHQNPKLIHREIGVAIYNDKREILLQKRSKSKKSKPGWWTVACAGHVLKGNTPEQTAHIELKEELGFDTQLEFVEKNFEQREQESRFDWFYVGKYNGDKFTIQKEEIDEVRFFNQEEFLNLLKTENVGVFTIKWCKKFWGDELLDLVNENDEVIGEVWRSTTIGHPELIFREVAVLINDDKNRLLLQRRSHNKKTYPGYWIISAGGHVGKGKNPEDEAHKELMEEMGFDAPLKLAFKQLMMSPESKSMAYAYTGEYNGKEITIQKEEVDEARFFTKEEFLELEKNDKVEPASGQWCREFWGIK